jgi:hypothetical protein
VNETLPSPALRGRSTPGCAGPRESHPDDGMPDSDPGVIPIPVQSPTPCPPSAGRAGWTDYLPRLSSRRFQAFLVGVLTPVGAMVSGSLDVRAGVAAVIAAVVAWLASEGAVDAAAALRDR